MMFSIVLAPSVGANSVNAYSKLDKVQYAPGEQGTISITLRNLALDEPIELYNVTVIFEYWMLYTIDGWDEIGNWTIDYSDLDPIGSEKSIELDDIQFTVPTDGRAADTLGSTPVDMYLHTSKGVLHEEQRINVISPSTHSLQGAMDNVVLLLSVGAILAIVSAIIIAAAVFLSGRRPGVTWQKQE